MHVHRLLSEDICNEYEAQKMFSQSQAFQTEKNKKPDFDWYF